MTQQETFLKPEGQKPHGAYTIFPRKAKSRVLRSKSNRFPGTTIKGEDLTNYRCALKTARRTMQENSCSQPRKHFLAMHLLFELASHNPIIDNYTGGRKNVPASLATQSLILGTAIWRSHFFSGLYKHRLLAEFFDPAFFLASSFFIHSVHTEQQNHKEP